MNESKFEPYEKVLVRDDDEGIWTCNFFSHINKLSTEFKYVTPVGSYRQCIPYKGNESLLNTTGKQKRWRAAYKENYWYVSDEGQVVKCMEIFNDMDDHHYDYGNYFQTEEEAIRIHNAIFELNRK